MGALLVLVLILLAHLVLVVVVALLVHLLVLVVTVVVVVFVWFPVQKQKTLLSVFCRKRITRTGGAQQASSMENFNLEMDVVTVDVVTEGASSETTDCAELTCSNELTGSGTETVEVEVATEAVEVELAMEAMELETVVGARTVPHFSGLGQMQNPGDSCFVVAVFQVVTIFTRLKLLL